ncbi:hypothetical protein OROMI_034834 [Orobanche minor]
METRPRPTPQKSNEECFRQRKQHPHFPGHNPTENLVAFSFSNLELITSNSPITSTHNIQPLRRGCGRPLKNVMTGIPTNRAKPIPALRATNCFMSPPIIKESDVARVVPSMDSVVKGCLLPSLPADMVYDNSSGFSFTCDLRDNIEAPWPSSSSMTSLSLCAPGNGLEKPQYCFPQLFSNCLKELFIMTSASIFRDVFACTTYIAGFG